MKLGSLIGNIILYGYLAYLLYDSLIKEWDPWFAFVVGFLTFVAVVIQLMPSLHAAKVSPGEYPYED
ncbi:MAG TPA: hypothetical protein VES58_03580 [Syntrophobacteria bacterium]|nr:hypothetical protein [Syntrophobacteria bacterium]